MDDALLEQIRGAAERHGPEKARQLAQGIGVTLREARGQLLVPVIMPQPATQQAGFDQRLARAGATLDAVSRSWARLLVPVHRLEQLAQQFPDQHLRAPYPVHADSGVGSRVSESVALTAADGYQVGNLDGSGVRVAVVDLGFANLNNTISQGELPPGTCGPGFSQDFTGTGLQAGTPHGTGVAEHVADMAPGVELHCLKVGTIDDLENAADYIRTHNIKIANHSVAWALASYYDGNGPVNAIIDNSRSSDGVFWSVSSGNYARKHWRGTWLDTNGDNVLEFALGDDGFMGLSGSASSISVFLNWNQYGNNNKTDLDLYLLDKDGTVVGSSTITQSRFNDPAEAVGVSYQSGQAPYRVRVVRVGGSTSDLDITLFSFNHELEHRVAASSLMDPASAAGAFSVGAVDWARWQDTNPPIRSYSSQGPTNDGRQKPELVGPDGTRSLTYSTATGTSFSAPTTAGAAALLLQETPGLSAATLSNLLLALAVDVGAAGADPVYGAGKLQLPLIDSDGEGLTNVEEIGLGTDALDSDSDDDGLTDFEEYRTYDTNPLAADSDGDGLSDYEEIFIYGSDPLSANGGAGDLAPRGNADGVIDAADYLVLTRLVSGVIQPTPEELLQGDLNDNGSLDSGDLVLLLQAIMAAP